MKDFFLGVCTFALVGGMIKSFVSEENFSRYFTLFSGVIMLIIIATNITEVKYESYVPDRTVTTVTQENFDFESMVLADSADRLSQEIQALIFDEFGIACTLTVNLKQTSDAIFVDGISVWGTGYDERIVALLCDYFAVEEHIIDFNR